MKPPRVLGCKSHLSVQFANFHYSHSLNSSLSQHLLLISTHKMDTLLLSPSIPKRPCFTHTTPSPSPTEAIISRVSKSDRMDRILETFLSFSDSSSPISIDLSLERLIESKSTDSEQNQLIESALKLGSVLLEAGKRLQRKRFTKHNSLSWVLPSDLTIKVSCFKISYILRSCSFLLI